MYSGTFDTLGKICITSLTKKPFLIGSGGANYLLLLTVFVHTKCHLINLNAQLKLNLFFEVLRYFEITVF